MSLPIKHSVYKKFKSQVVRVEVTDPNKIVISVFSCFYCNISQHRQGVGHTAHWGRMSVQQSHFSGGGGVVEIEILTSSA